MEKHNLMIELMHMAPQLTEKTISVMADVVIQIRSLELEGGLDLKKFIAKCTRVQWFMPSGVLKSRQVIAHIASQCMEDF